MTAFLPIRKETTTVTPAPKKADQESRAITEPATQPYAKEGARKDYAGARTYPLYERDLATAPAPTSSDELDSFFQIGKWRVQKRWFLVANFYVLVPVNVLVTPISVKRENQT